MSDHSHDHSGPRYAEALAPIVQETDDDVILIVLPRSGQHHQTLTFADCRTHALLDAIVALTEALTREHEEETDELHEDGAPDGEVTH